MKKFTIAAVLLGCVAVSSIFARPALTDQQNKTEATAKVEQLQKERIETLENLYKILKRQYEAGRVDFYKLSHAENSLFKAKFEAASKPEERIALLKEQLKVAKGSADFVEKQWKSGFAGVTEVDYLKEKADCLKIEIKLAKEVGKADEK